MESPNSTNHDAAEIAKFDAAAHRFWDVDGEFKPLHKLNPVRARYVEERATLRGARVLDVGCGGGLLAESLARAGAQVTAIDLASSMIDTARMHALDSGLQIDYRVDSAESLVNAHAGKFDVVTCMEMLEHVPDPASVIRACATLLKPGGTLFLSTLNRTPFAFGAAILGAEYLLHLLPRGTHQYAQFLRPSEIAGELRANGLVLDDLRGLAYNPLTRRAWLTATFAVNYLACASRPA
jgi:2-polyprenyl-6-hydroxyphenyl methylase/3-demethylubiquinone-9 3-methyltransferase